MTSVNLENNPTKPQRRTFFVADLKCYMCGSVVGSVESEQSLTAAPQTTRPVLVRQSGQATPSTVANWRRLRCDRCGGPLFLDESDVVTRRYEDYNWLDERPRRAPEGPAADAQRPVGDDVPPPGHQSSLHLFP